MPNETNPSGSYVDDASLNFDNILTLGIVGTFYSKTEEYRGRRIDTTYYSDPDVMDGTTAVYRVRKNYNHVKGIVGDVLESIQVFDFAWRRYGSRRKYKSRMRAEQLYANESIKKTRLLFYKDASDFFVFDYSKTRSLDQRQAWGSPVYSIKTKRSFFDWSEDLESSSSRLEKIHEVVRKSMNQSALVGSTRREMFEVTHSRKLKFSFSDSILAAEKKSRTIAQYSGSGFMCSRKNYRSDTLADPILISTDEHQASGASNRILARQNTPASSGTTEVLLSYTYGGPRNLTNRVVNNLLAQEKVSERDYIYIGQYIQTLNQGTYLPNQEKTYVDALYRTAYKWAKNTCIEKIKSMYPPEGTLNQSSGWDETQKPPLESIIEELGVIRNSLVNRRHKIAIAKLIAYVQAIHDSGDNITANTVASTIALARNQLRLISGFMDGPTHLLIRFWLLAIEAKFGVLASAEAQCEFLEAAAQSVCNASLRGKSLLNCDIAIWGIEGLQEPVQALKAPVENEVWIFDPKLCVSAAQICSSSFESLKTDEYPYDELHAALMDAINRARPVLASDDVNVQARMVNIALARCGVSRRIKSMDDGSTEADVAKVLFEQCRRKILAAHHWGFALREVQLTGIKNTFWHHDCWPFFCRLPSEVMTVVGIWAGTRNPTLEQMKPYEVMQRKIFCEVEKPWVRYVANVGVSEFSELALDALAWELAAEMTMPLAVKPDLAEAQFRMAELALQRAGAHSLNQNQPDPPPRPDFITKRF